MDRIDFLYVDTTTIMILQKSPLRGKVKICSGKLTEKGVVELGLPKDVFCLEEI
jgi:hypothetical protein